MALISRTVTVLGIITSKSAIALFLLRIVAKKWQKWILWITIGTTAIICIITVFVSWFACQPISKYLSIAWQSNTDHHPKAMHGPRSLRALVRSTQPRPCLSAVVSTSTWVGENMLTQTKVWSVIVDFFLAGLPWVVLYPLNLRKTQNLNIAVSLSMGAIAGILGIVRSWAIDWDQENETDARTAAAVMWAFAEFVLSTITASIPSLWPLYRSLRGHPRASGSGPSGSHPSEEDEEFAETARKRRRFWSRPNQSVKEIANDPDEMALSPNLSDKPLPSPPSDTSIEAGRVNSMESILREQRKYGVHTKDISVSSKADSAWEHADYRTAPG